MLVLPPPFVALERPPPLGLPVVDGQPPPFPWPDMDVAFPAPFGIVACELAGWLMFVCACRVNVVFVVSARTPSTWQTASPGRCPRGRRRTPTYQWHVTFWVQLLREHRLYEAFS